MISSLPPLPTNLFLALYRPSDPCNSPWEDPTRLQGCWYRVLATDSLFLTSSFHFLLVEEIYILIRVSFWSINFSRSMIICRPLWYLVVFYTSLLIINKNKIFGFEFDNSIDWFEISLDTSLISNKSEETFEQIFVSRALRLDQIIRVPIGENPFELWGLMDRRLAAMARYY